jgi:FG-GAP-like repeat
VVSAAAATCAFVLLPSHLSAAAAGQVFVKPVGVAAVDLNGDGIQDVVTADEQPNGVSVLLGKGAGLLGTPVRYASGGSSQAIAAGDLNHDGKQDLLVSHADTGDVSVMLGHGDGSLGAPVSYPVGDSPFGLVVADVDGDGAPDLAVANADSDDISLLLGKGDGSFGAARSFALAGSPFDLVIADLDGDGRMDIAAPSFTADVVSVLLQASPGQFTRNDPAAGSFPGGIASADFNGDHVPDLATGIDGSVAILTGLGGGRFAAPRRFPAGPEAEQLVAADLNGDGKVDLVSATGTNVLVLLGHGDGTFATPVSYRAGVHVVSVAAADFNGDGAPDLATANFQSGNTSVLLGRGDGSFGPAVNYALGAPAPPTIGRPTAVPARPAAGKRFTVTFAVQRGDNGLPLTSGKMTGHARVRGGRVLADHESFRNGKARLSVVVPKTAKGKQLRVDVTIRAATGKAATSIVSYPIR